MNPSNLSSMPQHQDTLFKVFSLMSLLEQDGQSREDPSTFSFSEKDLSENPFSFIQSSETTPITRRHRTDQKTSLMHPYPARGKFMIDLAHIALHSVGQCIDNVDHIIKSNNTKKILYDVEKRLLSNQKIEGFIMAVSDGSRRYFVHIDYNNMTSLFGETTDLFNKLTNNKFKGVDCRVNPDSELCHLRAGNVDVELIRSE